MAARYAAAAPAGGDPFAVLPHVLALAIFSRLTVEQRLRCIEVCRGWRATLADHNAWFQLDLTRADGSECSEALLRAATSRACGQLRLLRLACGDALQVALFDVAVDNAVTLQELRISTPATTYPQRRSVEDLEELLRAAPQLRTLAADVVCFDAADAQPVLRNEPPFGPVRVRHLTVGLHVATADAVLALAADLAAHASLTSVWLSDASLGSPAALDAVVDAALARRLSAVKLTSCSMPPASAPALARLLGGNTLTELCIGNVPGQLLDAPAAALLANALRANTSLTALTFSSMDLWRDPAVAAELLGALTAHPRLQTLDLSWNDPDDDGMQAAEAGAALAALLLANAPALRELNIGRSELGDEGMGPVLEALRHNTYLRTLKCRGTQTSDAFARNTLLPAVRANTSLRELVAAEEEDEAEDEESKEVAAREAEALVAARAQPQ
jgi:hypothetical protein